jgi:hypothetical protein
MTEDFLQFIWKYGLFNRNEMVADNGEQVVILSLGEHNMDSGPDFLNARIKIGQTTWAGNVEMHQRSSDWVAHKHKDDKAYDNVILHVVYRYDQPVYRASGELIPTVVLTFNEQLYESYRNLIDLKKGLSCMERITSIDPLIIDIWLNALVVERLQEKTGYFSELLQQYKNNREEVLYIGLARAFGFGLNAQPFEMTARSLPLAILSRHRNNEKQMEALLFGQAGFLNEPVLFSPYYQDLFTEYNHLKKKYHLVPVQQHLWKFLRLRPVNFPCIRISQFATLLRNSGGLFSRIAECKDYSAVKAIFNIRASDFWDTHYSFHTTSPLMPKKMGTDSTCSIVINAVVPFLFTYGHETANQELKDRAVTWLSYMPAEKNRITRRWAKYGLATGSALYSQAVVQLYNHYCRNKRCLACSIGVKTITNAR